MSQEGWSQWQHSWIMTGQSQNQSLALPQPRCQQQLLQCPAWGSSVATCPSISAQTLAGAARMLFVNVSPKGERNGDFNCPLKN